MSDEVVVKETDTQFKKGTNAQFDRMGTGSISKLLAEFAIPAIISLIVGGLYNVLSAIFLGQGVGTLGLAVSAVANPIMILFMAFAMLVGTGGNALAAIRLGEGKKSEAELVLGNTFTLGIIVWIFVLVIAFVFIDPILVISGATEETWELSKVFIQIISVGSIFQILGMGINNFIRSAGDPRRALWSMLSGNLVCIALSFLFVMVFQWGVPGQGFATIIGQAVSAGIIFFYFTKSPKSPFKLYRKNLRFRGRVPLKILALGSASFLLQIAVTVVSFVINNQVVLYGAMSHIGETGCFAVFAVIQRVAMFVMFPVMGITIAAQPILGYNYGAKLPERIRTTLKLSLISSVIICVVLWAIIEMFTASICILFGIEEELLDFCIIALRTQTMFMPVMAFQIVIANYFQATGRPVRSTFLSLTRQLLFLIPLYIGLPILIGNFFPGTEQIMGVVMGPPCADVLSFICAVIFIVIEFRRLKKEIADSKASGDNISSGSTSTTAAA